MYEPIGMPPASRILRGCKATALCDSTAVFDLTRKQSQTNKLLCELGQHVEQRGTACGVKFEVGGIPKKA